MMNWGARVLWHSTDRHGQDNETVSMCNEKMGGLISDYNGN